MKTSFRRILNSLSFSAAVAFVAGMNILLKISLEYLLSVASFDFQSFVQHCHNFLRNFKKFITGDCRAFSYHTCYLTEMAGSLHPSPDLRKLIWHDTWQKFCKLRPRLRSLLGSRMTRDNRVRSGHISRDHDHRSGQIVLANWMNAASLGSPQFSNAPFAPRMLSLLFSSDSFARAIC